MKAIVRLGNGNYYLSKVFGVFNDSFVDSFKKNQYYYLVFDESMKTLIPKFQYQQNTKYIIPEILIYENDTSDMDMDQNHCGKVKFLSDIEIRNILDGEVRDTVLSKCKKYIDRRKLDYIEIKNTEDIENFMIVSGMLHDGYIKEISEKGNQLYVLFDDVWGCQIEMVFEGNIRYQNLREEGDVWWYGSSMVFDHDGIILTDEEDYQVGEDLSRSLTWFKAKKVKYKVIPN